MASSWLKHFTAYPDVWHHRDIAYLPPPHQLLSALLLLPLLFVPVTQGLAGLSHAPRQNVFSWNMIKTKALGPSCLLTTHCAVFLLFPDSSQPGRISISFPMALVFLPEVFLITWPLSSMHSGSLAMPWGELRRLAGP